MHLRGGQEVPYVKGDGWRATELRYLGPDGTSPLAMTLIMPDDLATFESRLTGTEVSKIAASLAKERTRLVDDVTEGTEPEDCGSYPYSLSLFMPRFSIDTRAQLKELLAALGMPDAFSAGTADFSGIHVPTGSDGPIHIGNVIHQANIDVDEKGTEAAAATAIGMDTRRLHGAAARQGGHPAPRPSVLLRAARPGDGCDPVRGPGRGPRGRPTIGRPARGAQGRTVDEGSSTVRVFDRAGRQARGLFRRSEAPAEVVGDALVEASHGGGAAAAHERQGVGECPPDDRRPGRLGRTGLGEEVSMVHVAGSLVGDVQRDEGVGIYGSSSLDGVGGKAGEPSGGARPA